MTNGRVKVKYETAASAGAGATEVPLKPAEAGVIWRLLWAEGEQNDGDVTCAWKWYDPENPAGVQLFAMNVSANIPLALGGLAVSEQGPGAAPVIITHSRYPAYIFVASGAAKNGVVVALVDEQIGVEGTE